MSLNVCFICPDGYGAIDPAASGHIGGAEVQVGILALEMARRGHRVSFVSLDHGQADGATVNGVRAFATCRPEAGLPGLRFLHPRWTGLRKALARADADLYIHASADAVTGQALHWCRRNGRRFVFASASNADCTEPLINLHTRRDRGLYRYGLRHADAVIAQTRDQQRMLQEHFGRQSVLIPYCCPDGDYRPRTAPGEPRVLWVGRFSAEKRLEVLLDLAERLPQVAFDVVGDANRPTDYSEGLKARSARLANVTLHGRLAQAQVQTFYPRATALACTSAWEGFPNVFLESWRAGLPIVSTVDPDNLIATHRLGGVATDVAGLQSHVEALAGDDENWRACSHRAREYYEGHHTTGRAARLYEQLLENLLAQSM